MIKLWFETKKKELTIKLMLYNAIFTLKDEHAEFIDFIKIAYESLNGLSADEFRKELIKQIATLIHNSNSKE